jgi:hypothetical protein
MKPNLATCYISSALPLSLSLSLFICSFLSLCILFSFAFTFFCRLLKEECRTYIVKGELYAKGKNMDDDDVDVDVDVVCLKWTLRIARYPEARNKQSGSEMAFVVDQTGTGMENRHS